MLAGQQHASGLNIGFSRLGCLSWRAWWCRMELKGKRRKSCRQAGSRRTRTASSSASGAPVRSSTAASATADMRAEPSGGASRPYGVSCAAVSRVHQPTRNTHVQQRRRQRRR